VPTILEHRYRALMCNDDAPTPAELFAEMLARPAWMSDAACREHPEISFFPRRGEDVGPARAICDGCLVSDECLDHACSTGWLGVPAQGIWGGTSARERKRARGAARPAA
jgi:WhiB family redox-sensing transcriptional regulator